MELSKIEYTLKRSEIENYSRPQGGFRADAIAHLGDPEEIQAGFTEEEVQHIMESHAYSCYMQECHEAYFAESGDDQSQDDSGSQSDASDSPPEMETDWDEEGYPQAQHADWTELDEDLSRILMLFRKILVVSHPGLQRVRISIIFEKPEAFCRLFELGLVLRRHVSLFAAARRVET